MTTSTPSDDEKTTAGERPSIRFDTVVLDTDDISGLAEFYNQLLGWRVEHGDDTWITIGGGSGARMAFQLAEDYKAPTWPDPEIPQQFHLDLRVSDMEATAAYAESIGGRRLNTEKDFIVFLDPSGHPFCLCIE
jgi:catechol-2,3-dioxygenase